MAKPRVEIEWPDDLTYEDDVTSDIIGEIECWRGRSYHHPHYRSQGVGVAGHCTFVLRNDGGRYSIDDDDDAPIGAKVQVSLQVGASTWRVMWTGYIDSYDYQYRRQGYDRIAVRALGRMAQLETATWSIAANDTADPRAYDVINAIVQGVTGEEPESGYNANSNRNLEPPGGSASEGSRNWSVRLENFQIEEAPALQTIRDAATISFAHVYETAAGKIRIQGLPSRQSKIDGAAAMTFRDSSGTGVRVHDYEVSLKTDRIANVAARSITERFEPVDTSVRHIVAQGDGRRLTTARDEIFAVPLYLNREPYIALAAEFNQPYPAGLLPPFPSGYRRDRHQWGPLLPYPGDPQTLFYRGRADRGATTPIRTLPVPYPAGMRLTVNFVPEPYTVTDPDGVLDPVTVTPDPFVETVDFANDFSESNQIILPFPAGVFTGDDRVLWIRSTTASKPDITTSNSARARAQVDVKQRTVDGIRTKYWWTSLLFWINRDSDAQSAWNWRWTLEWMPYTPSSSGQFIASNRTSITRYGRRGYAIPGIFWGPDVASGDSTRDAQYLDIRSFVGYIVRDEFLGKPGYYGTIVVDLTRQFYPTTGASNPDLDVGDKITLYQGTNSRDYLVSAIRYRFRQGEQLRAQIECAPARVM